MESTTGPKKRKFGKRKNPKMMKKKVSHFPEGVGELKPKKIDRKMKKLFRKRARDYDSDEESEDKGEENDGDGDSSEAAEEHENQEVNKEDNEFSDEDEAGEIQPGITKLTEGCRAFRMAFKSIIKKAVNDDPLVKISAVMFCEFCIGLRI